MPQCQDCGNKEFFSSSKVSSETPSANPPSPLTASFSPDEELPTLEYTGNNDLVLERAWKNPRAYFDTCGICGSNRIHW